MLPVTRTDSMKKKDIVLTQSLLTEKEAKEELLDFFKKQYPNGSAPIFKVLSDLQEFASTSTEYLGYVEYVGYAIWLLLRFPSTQKPLVLNELTGKFIFHNGDVTIKKGVKGECFIVVNGNLNIEGNIELTGWGKIWAKKIKAINIKANGHAIISARGALDAENIEAEGLTEIWTQEIINVQNITAYAYAEIWAQETINVRTIWAYDFARIETAETVNTENIKAEGVAEIGAEKKVHAINITADGWARIRTYGIIDAENIEAYDKARIWASETIDAENIEAYDEASIWAFEKINVQNIATYDEAEILEGEQ